MRTLLFSLIAFVAFIPVAVFAQQNLVNLPIGETGDFNDYINAVYLMFISIAALIAVIKIIIAGVKYMFSDIVTQKSDAKNDIKGALLGLLVILAAVVVLTIINPDLTTFNPEIAQIERQERPETPANSGSYTGSDANDIEEVCGGDLLQCDIQGCDVLDFGSEGSSWLESVQNLVGLDYVMNRTSCSIWCDLRGGEIISGNSTSGQCISPRTDSVNEAQDIIIGNIMENSPMCDTNGCQVEDCSFIRWEVSCENWCENRGGTAVNLSFSSGSSQCITPVPEGTDTSTIPCTSVGRGQFNCYSAATLCKSYGRTPEIDPGRDDRSSQSSISCD